MKLLILGGTQFVGRHTVSAALERDHQVTLFHRGNRNPFPQCENILGDREHDLERLQGQWDAVIDTCGYVPRIVGLSAKHLEPFVGRYCFISSISAYASLEGLPDEDAPLGQLEMDTEEISGSSYGPLKALCEQAVTDTFSARGLVIRPGLVVGPHDPTDRFPYWVDRIARGGEVIAPEGVAQQTCFIDARDLAAFVIHALEANLSGAFNADGRSQPLPDVLEVMRFVSGSDATFTWATREFLLEQTVKPWAGADSLPLWTAGDPLGTNIEKALAAGLTHRPLEQTVIDTLEWLRSRGADHVWRSGISAGREAALLEAWRQR
jgi:2'-hydroxyisoflavone reductase